ncbi:MAG TPA: 1-acyl-sn-glycerol-3-phosphate acyltransferase [Candidatus Limnocylindrales bacterium]|nr:1-acyl-sn-glycerol-3-phosphate acyltransferase [Candidatus Limnocylindrales bacterium]
MLPRIITKLVGWTVAVFYDLERTGPTLPDGPVLVTANHPNSLVDPLVVFHTAGRPTRPLAKAPLFEQALVGTVLRGLGGLPVYRRQDDPALMHLNDRTFDAAVEALREGGAVQIYPEGRSHSEPAMSPLRTGAARIALQAEQRSGWALGLRIQPVGLTYTRKHAFRGSALAAFGEPFDVLDLRELYERDEREAVRELTARIQAELGALTLNFEQAGDAELVDVAERLYARQKKLSGWRERDPMAERLPRLHRFAEGVRWLRAADPERLDAIRADVRRYLRLLTLFGASEGDVPKRYPLAGVLRYAARQLLMLGLVLPVALVGMAVWAVPFFLTRYVAPRFRPELDQVATYKVGMAVLAFPLWWAVLEVGTWLTWGVRPTLAALVLLPVMGLAAIAWADRQADVREDVRVFVRARRLRRGRDRLAEQRARLVKELDELARDWRADKEAKTTGA